MQKDLSSSDGKELIFHGLDGHVTIFLNNHILGNATNSFVRYRFDVAKLLVIFLYGISIQRFQFFAGQLPSALEQLIPSLDAPNLSLREQNFLHDKSIPWWRMWNSIRCELICFQSSENHLQLEFESPVVSAERLSQQSAHSVPPNCVPPDYNGECHVNFLRRMQASFGWDWGLAVPSVGIW